MASGVFGKAGEPAPNRVRMAFRVVNAHVQIQPHLTAGFTVRVLEKRYESAHSGIVQVRYVILIQCNISSGEADFRSQSEVQIKTILNEVSLSWLFKTRVQLLIKLLIYNWYQNIRLAIIKSSIPASTKHLYNIYTMLAQRLRRWSSIV